MMLKTKYKIKYALQSLLGPFRRKKCPYCLGSFRVFEVRSYKGLKNCPKCGSGLMPEILRLPIFVLALFPKEYGALFQKKCLTSAFITALFHKKGYILTPFSEKITLFLIARKGARRVKPLCIVRFLSLSETDFEEAFSLRKFTDGLILFADQPTEEGSSSIPKALRVFLQHMIHPRTNRIRPKKSFPLSVVTPSLKNLAGYLPHSLSAYTTSPSPEFKGDERLFSGYVRSLLGFWYGMPLIHTLEKSSSCLLYSALNLDEPTEDMTFLSYEMDIFSYFLSCWGFKIRKRTFKGFSLKRKSFRVSFGSSSFEKEKKQEKPFKEKKDPSLRSE